MRDLRVGDMAEVCFGGLWIQKGRVAEIVPPIRYGSGVVRIGKAWFPRAAVRAVPGPDEKLDRKPGYVREVRREA